MLRCGQAQAMLSRDLDGRLSPEEATALQAHIGACEACRREADALRGAWSLLAADLDSPAPSDLRTRVLARVRATRQRSAVGLGPSGLALRSLLAAACVAVAVMSGGVLGYWATSRATPALSAEHRLAHSDFGPHLGPAPPLTVSGAFEGLDADVSLTGGGVE